MKKVIVIALFLTATLLAACSSDDSSNGGSDNSEQSGGSGNDSTAAAVVNGEEISQDQFESNVKSVKQQYEQFGMDPSEQEEQINQTAIDQLIGTELVIQKANESDIEVSEDEVNKQFEQMKTQYTENDQWDQFLEENGMTEEEVKQELKTSAKVQKYVDNNVDVPEVTDEEAKKQYDTMAGQQEDIGDFEEMKDQIKQQLSSQKQSQAVNDHIKQLREEADITVNV
ncbi:SurA N-terminal domain-containing protein [Salimicrobium sp. PL1-032A]|uniref:SurA N-terminal domain-containing protein n=1 Tax=Salimicrobium sp. PL1-032A TaxID=3095364 RepID=UPI0032611199